MAAWFQTTLPVLVKIRYKHPPVTYTIAFEKQQSFNSAAMLSAGPWLKYQCCLCRKTICLWCTESLVKTKNQLVGSLIIVGNRETR